MSPRRTWFWMVPSLRTVLANCLANLSATWRLLHKYFWPWLMWRMLKTFATSACQQESPSLLEHQYANIHRCIGKKGKSPLGLSTSPLCHPKISTAPFSRFVIAETIAIRPQTLHKTYSKTKLKTIQTSNLHQTCCMKANSVSKPILCCELHAETMRFSLLGRAHQPVAA